MPQSPRTPSTNGRERFAWVADLGGSHVTAAVIEIGDERRILARESAEIQPQGNAGQISGSLAVAMRAVAPDAPRWTIALPGPFDYQRGIGTFEGVAKFWLWRVSTCVPAWAACLAWRRLTCVS